MALRIVRFINLLLMSLVTGGTVRSRLELRHSTQFATPVSLDVMWATIFSNLAALRLLRHRKTPAFVLTFSGFIGVVAVMVMTVILELPVNEEPIVWPTAAPQPDLVPLVGSPDRWERLHTMRAVTAMGGLGALLLAAVSPAPASSGRAGDAVR